MTECFDFTQNFVIITKLGIPASGLQALHAPLRTKKTDSNMGLLSFHLCAQSLCCSLPRRVVHQVRLSPAAWTKHRNALLGRCKMQPFDGTDGITSWCAVPDKPVLVAIHCAVAFRIAPRVRIEDPVTSMRVELCRNFAARHCRVVFRIAAVPCLRGWLLSG